MEHTYIYYDEQDVLSYFVGTRAEFLKMLRENPMYTRTSGCCVVPHDSRNLCD